MFKEIKSIIQLVQVFKDQETCIAHLERIRWNNNPVSPFDPTSKVYKCARGWKCKNTGKYFNVKTGTLFDNTKTPLQKWFIAIYLVTAHKKGISSVQLAKDIDVTQKTAWFMLQRIRACFGNDNQKLQNEVEVDETYVGGKNKNRHADKKIKGSQGRSTKSKTPVVGMVERGGILKASVTENTTARTLTKQIADNISQTAKVYTDEWVGYNSIKRIYDHSVVKHNSGEFVRGRVHTNTIEGFWSIMKRGVVGIYHFTSRKHLQKYVDEFVFRYNTRLASESDRFNMLLSQCDVRTTYNTLING